MKKYLAWSVLFRYSFYFGGGMIFLTSCSSGNVASSQPNTTESCTILGLNESIEVVYDYDLYHTNIQGGDYADVPVRPFFVRDESSLSIRWFASNANGYCQSYGLPVSESVPDILAQIRRVINPTTGACDTWVSSIFNSMPNQYSANSYYNELWMVVPYTLDGVNIYALIHNEYHTVPTNITNVYGNLIGASSTNAAGSFNLFQTSGDTNANLPVIAAPYPYGYPLEPYQGEGGMFAQTNIIKWGNYYYMLVNEVLNKITDQPNVPSGVCIYRTNNLQDFTSWRGWESSTNSYDIPVVESYPLNLVNPQQYWCSPIPGLPDDFHYSWSYNVVLHKFILVGLGGGYNGASQFAFVYTLANLNPDTGVLSAADGSNNYQIQFLRYVNTVESWQQIESIAGQYYPSILDPTSYVLSDSTVVPNVESGDLNFQYSAQSPYLYYTYFHPRNESGNANGEVRDVFRQKIAIQCK